MTRTLPAEMPGSFGAGETVQYRRVVPEFPATDGWTLTVYVAGVGAPFHVDAAADGSAYTVELPASTTATITAGTYTFEERVHKASPAQTFMVGRGTVAITPNIATAVAGDMVLWAEKALGMIEARIAGSTNIDVMRYQLHNRALEKYSLDELMKFRERLRAEVSARSRGGRFSTPVLIRFPPAGINR